MFNRIIELYVKGKNEKQIKDELLLLGFKKRAIDKEFKVFINRFKTVNEVFEYYQNK